MSDSLKPFGLKVHQAPLSMGFSKQQYLRGLPFIPPGNLSNPGIEHMSPMSPALQAYSLPTEPLSRRMIKSTTVLTEVILEKRGRKQTCDA